MDKALIANWNAEVKPDDVVYHLGDFCFGRSDRVITLLRQLNGKIKFIFGNHDEPMHDYKKIKHLYPDLENKVTFLGNLAEVIVESQTIVLCHYAMRTFNKMHRGYWHLYGHSHGALPDDKTSLSFDVGIDCHNYKPISFERVGEIMSTKTFTPLDHHGE